MTVSISKIYAIYEMLIEMACLCIWCCCV